MPSAGDIDGGNVFLFIALLNKRQACRAYLKQLLSASPLYFGRNGLTAIIYYCRIYFSRQRLTAEN